MKELAGRTAVITGAASGAGRALALECARERMNVVIADVELEPAQGVVQEIEKLDRRAIAVQTDVTDRASVEALADRAYAEFGEVNLLINNAGVSRRSPLAEPADDNWNWILAVNLWGPLNGVYAFVPRMREQEGPAHIVNTASVSGLVARRNVNGIYTSVKHALVGLTNVLRDELEPDGIVVSCWCPGGMLTNIGDSGRNRQAEFGGTYSEEARRTEREPNPMTAEDVAPRVLAAIREERRYIFSHPATRATVEEYYRQILDDYDAGERIAAEVG